MKIKTNSWHYKIALNSGLSLYDDTLLKYIWVIIKGCFIAAISIIASLLVILGILEPPLYLIDLWFFDSSIEIFADKSLLIFCSFIDILLVLVIIDIVTNDHYYNDLIYNIPLIKSLSNLWKTVQIKIDFED